MIHFSVLEPWEDPRGGQIDRIRVDNGTIAIEVLSLGGIIRSLWAPDRQGERGNVVLGCDNAADYLNQSAYLGAMIGRYSNRIAKGQFSDGTQTYHLDTDPMGNCLNGGTEGFHRKKWHLGTLSDGVRLSLVSPDGDMGFPGSCNIQLDYRLAGNNLYVEVMASVDKACPVSLTQHSYFNLDGSDTCDQHALQLDANQYLTMDDVKIPTGIANCQDTLLDFTTPQSLAKILSAHGADEPQEQGLDLCYLLDNDDNTVKRVGRLSSAVNGRAMTLYSNQPSMHLYSANYLGGVQGKLNKTLKNHQGLCLEPQQVPDAPNQPDLPGKPWLKPGELYHHISRYQFDTDA